MPLLQCAIDSRHKFINKKSIVLGVKNDQSPRKYFPPRLHLGQTEEYRNADIIQKNMPKRLNEIVQTKCKYKMASGSIY